MLQCQVLMYLCPRKQVVFVKVKALEMGVDKPREGFWAKQEGLAVGTD